MIRCETICTISRNKKPPEKPRVWRLCRERDLNSHSIKYRGILSPLCLPIPPSRLLDINCRNTCLIEASTRFELVHDGFANRSLTAWVRRLKKTSCLIQTWRLIVERKIGFEPTTLTLAT